MGLTYAREKAVKCLNNGRIQHETNRSGDINEKNLLLTGLIEPEEVIEIIQRCKGKEYESSMHHFAEGIAVHIMKTNGWYIKFYFIEPDIIFISVHM